MRLLVVIPHFVRPAPPERRLYGSEAADAHERRSAALSRVIAALHATLGPLQGRAVIAYSGGRTGVTHANRQRCSAIDIVVATLPEDHAIDRLTVPSSWYRHHVTLTAPRELGFACHELLREAAGAYDWYGYLEDDIHVADPYFLRKIAHFVELTGTGNVLLPNRFETYRDAGIRKLYIDSLQGDTLTAEWQDINDGRRVAFRHLGDQVVLERPSNPNAGCFFLRADQFAHWLAQPYFGDRDAGFVGPIESACNLGVMKTFKVYKPAAENAGYLEVEHLSNRDWMPYGV